MGAIAYALVFGVSLGLLATDAELPWLKVIGYTLSAWMFLAAILQALRISKQDD